MNNINPLDITVAQISETNQYVSGSFTCHVETQESII